jgi:ribonuclease P protein component
LFVNTPKIKIFYSFQSNNDFVISQYGFSVAKKSFPKATDRNKIKRLLRESWRLHKNGFVEQLIQKNQKGIFWFNYIGKELPSFQDIDNSIQAFIAIFESKHEIN